MVTDKDRGTSTLTKYRFLIVLSSIALICLSAIWLLPAWRTVLGRTWVRWHEYLVFLLIIILAVATLTIGLWRLLKRHLAPEGFEQKKDFILLVAQILGGATLVVSLFSTWQTITKTQREVESQQEQIALNQELATQNLKVALETLDATRRRQLADQYAKAVEQIGSPNLEIRTGAIYAFEQIAADSKEYHWPIMQVLSAYVRGKAPCNGGKMPARLEKQMPVDIEAVMTVIGRRKYRYMQGEGDKDTRINLRNADLRGLVLKGDIHFEGIDFQGACFDEARLRGVHLDEALLKDASLRSTDLYEATLKGTGFENACLENADLQQTKGYDWDWVAVAKGLSKAKLPQNIKRQKDNDSEFRDRACNDE